MIVLWNASIPSSQNELHLTVDWKIQVRRLNSNLVVTMLFWQQDSVLTVLETVSNVGNRMPFFFGVFDLL